LDEEELELASDPYGSEYASVHAEELAGAAISLHLPEERTRIREVLASFPPARETKIDKLLSGLGVTPWSWTRTRPVIDQAARRRLVFSNCTGLR
jgi:hypothetical protein